MKFYKLVNNNWVETGSLTIAYGSNLYYSNIDKLAYKMGYVRIYSQTTRRPTQNFYYKADCAKAQSSRYYLFDDRNSFLTGDERKAIYFSCSQSRLDSYTNDELKRIYNLERCEDCGILGAPRDNVHVGRNHVFCTECVEKHAKKCAMCGTWYLKATSVTPYNLLEYTRTIYVCNHCKENFERNLHTCADCGGLTRQARSIRGAWYCGAHFGAHDCPNLIHGYHEGNMPLQFQFASNEQPNEKLLKCGAEIETECPKDTEPKYVAFEVNGILNKDNQLCKMERDGSLYNGFETITQPGTPNWYYETADKFKKFFELLQQSGCSWYNEYGNDTCGLHIHVNRSFFNDYDYENRLVYLFQRLKQKIRIFSQRNNFDYCHIVSDTATWDNIYNLKRNNMYGHGTAVNCANRNTIEFRIFRGTTSYEMFMACIEFVRNFCTYVRDNTDINTIERATFEDVINYCDNKFLNTYCQRLGLLGGAC